MIHQQENQRTVDSSAAAGVLNRLQDMQSRWNVFLALSPNTLVTTDESCWDVIRVDQLLESRNYAAALIARADTAARAVELAEIELNAQKSIAV